MPAHPSTTPARSAHGPRAAAPPSAGEPFAHPASASAQDVIRWAAFSCLLVPVVLVGYGTSFGGAVAAALGLAAVTIVCRALLRRSERALRSATGERDQGHGRSAGSGRGRAVARPAHPVPMGPPVEHASERGGPGALRDQGQR